MDNEKYFKYFEQKPKHWSLVDFDSWTLNNVKHLSKQFWTLCLLQYLSVTLQESSSKRKIKKARELLSSKKSK